MDTTEILLNNGYVLYTAEKMAPRKRVTINPVLSSTDAARRSAYSSTCYWEYKYLSHKIDARAYFKRRGHKLARIAEKRELKEVLSELH